MQSQGNAMAKDPETEMVTDSEGFPKVIPWGSLPPYLTIKQVCAHIIPKKAKTIRRWIHEDLDYFDTDCCTRRCHGIYIMRDRLKKWMESGQSERTIGRRR